MRNRFIASITFVLFLGLGGARAGEVVNALDDGVAMDGFDVVAYFTEDRPMKGSSDFKVSHKGRTWLFASQEHADLFASDPEKYEPQYNGWCAYGVSEGYGAEVDFIDGWSIIDGKLYLNWDAGIKKDFLKSLERRLAAADANWPKVHKGLEDGSVDLYRHSDYRSAKITHPQELE